MGPGPDRHGNRAACDVAHPRRVPGMAENEVVSEANPEEIPEEIRVGVFGAAGRMGTAVCQAVATDRALALVAAVDPAHAGIDIRQVAGVSVPGLHVAPTADALGAAGAAVAVDFTRAEAAMINARWCSENGVHMIIGTSGLGDEDKAELASLFGSKTGPNCIMAANFAIGAVLLMRFAEMAAPFFETAEIIELHHDGKADAPSGTALRTAERMAAASTGWAPDPTKDLVIEGARGGVGAGGIRVHSVRMRGMVAHQEVILGTVGQTLTLRHDTIDRDSFMPGVLLAVKRVGSIPGLTIGLDALLGFG